MKKYKLSWRTFAVLSMALMITSVFAIMPAMANCDGHGDMCGLEIDEMCACTCNYNYVDDKCDCTCGDGCACTCDYNKHKWHCTCCENGDIQPIPEFPTMAIPVLSIIGLMFIMGRRRMK